jgi:SAM-dependent methyltransferase
MTEFAPNEPLTAEACYWSELFSRPSFAPRYPSDAVIRWTFHNFPRAAASQTRLLDIGSGTGRHALFFAREGYQAAAIDFSPIAINELRIMAEGNGLVIDGHVAAADDLPFPDCTFDGVLAFGVLYYLPPEAMRKAVTELRRVLKPGGRAFVMIKSNRDSRAVFAEKMDGHQYHLTAAKEEITWPSEVGMTLTLLNRRSVRSCFSCFENISIDRSTVTHLNGRLIDDEWLIFAERNMRD